MVEVATTGLVRRTWFGQRVGRTPGVATLEIAIRNACVDVPLSKLLDQMVGMFPPSMGADGPRLKSGHALEHGFHDQASHAISGIEP